MESLNSTELEEQKLFTVDGNEMTQGNQSDLTPNYLKVEDVSKVLNIKEKFKPGYTEDQNFIGPSSESISVIVNWPILEETTVSGTKPPPYCHITQNVFLSRNPKKIEYDDVSICDCTFNAQNPENSCTPNNCINAALNIECTPGFCPCKDHCQNQRFQKNLYPKLKVLRTEGRGWGLFAGENLKKGDFIEEYCGEVIKDKVAYRRAATYTSKGEKNAYIMLLGNGEFVDATKKGSLARFLNHSCDPNCEARKWTVLGEIRVGVFASKDINDGEELTWDYNFEWFGGEKVECKCGAESCVGFLGAKSRAFKESLENGEVTRDGINWEDLPSFYDDDEEENEEVKSENSEETEKVQSENEEEVEQKDSASEEKEDIISVEKAKQKSTKFRGNYRHRELWGGVGNSKHLGFSANDSWKKPSGKKFLLSMVDKFFEDEQIAELQKTEASIKASQELYLNSQLKLKGEFVKGSNNTKVDFKEAHEYQHLKMDFLEQKFDFLSRILENVVVSVSRNRQRISEGISNIEENELSSKFQVAEKAMEQTQTKNIRTQVEGEVHSQPQSVERAQVEEEAMEEKAIKESQLGDIIEQREMSGEQKTVHVEQASSKSEGGQSDGVEEAEIEQTSQSKTKRVAVEEIIATKTEDKQLQLDEVLEHSQSGNKRALVEDEVMEHKQSGSKKTRVEEMIENIETEEDRSTKVEELKEKYESGN